MSYLFLFLEGIATFVSPCLLPLVPIYVTYLAGSERGTTRALVNSLGFVSGFSLVFVSLGAFSAAIGRLFLLYRSTVYIVMGAIVVLLGLNFLGVIHIGPQGARLKGKPGAGQGFLRSALFGIAFSISWTPCVGAFLALALSTAAASGSTFLGIAMLSVYSLGLAVPFVASALLIDKLKGAITALRKRQRAINAVSGILLVVVGVAMMFGKLDLLLIRG